MKTISIQDKFSKFSKNWHPHQIAIVDDMHVLLAKLKGEFVWHSHEDEDEMFQVIKGTLYMQFRDRTEIVKEGELIVVPKGLSITQRQKTTKRSKCFCLKKQQRPIPVTYSTPKHKLTIPKYK